MKKRIFTLLITVVMLLSLAIVASAAVSVNSEVAKRGDIVKITVNVSGIGDITSLAIIPQFDKDVFEFVSDDWKISDTPIMEDSFDGTSAVIAFTDPVSVSGDVYEMTFKVKDDADLGKSAFSCAIRANNVNIAVDSSTANGTVTVVCSHKNVTHISGEAATCIKTGIADHYFCSDCDTAFSDKACTKELKTTVLPIDSNNHGGNREIRNAVEATETAPGYTGDEWCLDCDKMILQGEVIPVIVIPDTDNHDHEFGEWKSNGQIHWKTCKICSVSVSSNHSWSWVIDKAATETATGLKHKECIVCGYKIDKNTVIPMISSDTTAADTTEVPDTEKPEDTTAKPEDTTVKPQDTTINDDTTKPGSSNAPSTGDIDVIAIALIGVIAACGACGVAVAKKRFN